MVISRQRVRGVSWSEPETVRRSPDFDRCHFCICQSAIEDRIDREKLVKIYIGKYVDVGVIGSFPVLLTNVEVHV